MRLSKKNARRLELVEARLVTGFIDALKLAMETQGLSKAGLARLMGTSKAWVNKIFHGQNMTLQTIARIAFALDWTPEIVLTEE